MTQREYKAMLAGRKSIPRGRPVEYRGGRYRLHTALKKGDNNAVLRDLETKGRFVHINPRDLVEA